MKAKIHPGVAIAAVVLVVLSAGFILSKAFNSGVVGKEYAPGQTPFVNKNLDTPPDESATRDAVQTKDPDGK